MSNHTGPKVKLSRRVGVPIADTPKHNRNALKPTGMNTYRRRRMGDYGVRLNEKQKLRFYYNVQEKQFVRYVKKASQSKGNTGENLVRLLESRLDNVVRCLTWAPTIWAARQLVAHGHVLMNGRKNDRPSCQVRPGDTITLKPRIEKVVRANIETLSNSQIPGWLSFDPKTLTATAQDAPAVDALPLEVNLNLIVEFYR